MVSLWAKKTSNGYRMITSSSFALPNGRLNRPDRGLSAVITNHGYLDNPTFRGMRLSLMRTFDDIYILDLHGNSLKKETCPDGSPDDNVFDIRQGVAIAFYIKQGGRKGHGNGVRHAELYGSRQRKYDWLNEHNRISTDWQRIKTSRADLSVRATR